MKTFKELKPGDEFVFANESDYPMELRGPWRKISPRMFHLAASITGYRAVVFHVTTAEVAVIPV